MWNRHPTARQAHLALVLTVFVLAALVLAALILAALGLPPAASLPARAADAGQAGAPAPVDVTTLGERTTLTPHLAYLRDPSRGLTAAEVAAPDMAASFVPFGAAVPNFGFSHDTFWVRLALDNPSSEPAPLVLHLDSPVASYVDLYEGAPAPGDEPAFATGALRPYVTRPLPGRGFAFPITAPAEQTTDYYLRINSDLPVYLSLDLWQPAAFHASQDQDEISWGIVLGMLLLMTGYNLLLFIALRDRNHLVLVAFGLLVAASTATAGGYVNRWLPPDAAGWWLALLVLTTVLVIAAFALLAISFLELRRRQPLAWRVLVGALSVVAAAGAVALLGRQQIGLVLAIGSLLVILPTIFLATVAAVRAGSRLALFLLLSQVVPIVAGMVQSLTMFGIGPKLPPLPLLVPLNSLLLLTLMSLALADRINLLRRETEAANAALRASEQRLNAYLDALPFNIHVHDKELKPLYVNAATRSTPNARAGDWFEQPYPVWVREFPVFRSGAGSSTGSGAYETYPIEQLPLMRAAEGKKTHADDLLVRTPMGDAAIEAWAVPLFDEGGQISAIVTAFQDITERRATENELASYREHLEGRVAQRTAELAALNANLAARVTELTAINEVSRRVMRIGDLHETLDEVAQILVDAFQAAGASVSLFDADRQRLEVVVLADRSDGALLPLAGQSFAYAAASGYSAYAQSAAVFQHPRELLGLPPAVREELAAHGVRQVVLAPLIARERSIGALALMATDPARTFSADEQRVVQTIAGQVAAAIDTVRLIDEVRRQRDVAETLRRTATALSRDLDQQNVFGSILEQLDQVFACDGAAVALVQGRELVTVAAKGLSAPSSGQRAALDGPGASQDVLRSKQPLVVEDSSDAPPIRSWLGAPLISGEGAIGVLSLDSAVPGSFDAAAAELLATFADQAAIAVVNARLYDQAQALAVAGERDRLARDLHDAVTQTIFSASLIASTLPERLPDLPPPVRADVDALQMLTKGALAEMRTLLLELRPERLAEVGLDVLLGQLAQAFAGRNGVPVEVNANCDPHYTPPYAVKIAFYRVVQEALNNVGKHAKAAHVTIRYSSRPGALRLAVIDDGQGFAPNGRGPQQMGLAIMRERAAAIGAQLTVDSEPGLGTHLFMVWSDENNTQTA